ncbi:L-lactate permease [Tessaracoccus antarcticus]|uniref:L-lactate permease n=1 Tax=Tessaracoccus antarcticus TaxID=2479848 RepID=A0A3M0G8H4_9ACTN|nr:L-lactate permease [Tessaracoccus antarcticus]RMB61341.1 L-lactate permease [Tessaracoccus antarcticus]
MSLLLAALPIVAVVLLMILKIPTLRVVLITLALTAVLSLLWFPILMADFVKLGPALGETILIVVVIVIGGTSLAELLTATGAQARIAEWLQQSAHNQGRAILIVGLGVAPFAETIIGWGLGLIVSVPLLIRIGLSVRQSATIGLLGILLGPWGSLAPAVLIMAELGDVSFHTLGLWIAVLSLPLIVIMSVAILVVGVGRREARAHVGEAAVAVITMWLVILGVSWLLGPPLAGVSGAVAAIVSLLLMGRLKHGQPIRMDGTVLRALSPYVFLGAGLLLSAVIVRLLDIGKIGEVLSGPAFWLTVTVFVAPRLLGAERRIVSTARREGWRRAVPVALTTTLFVAFGGVLSLNGMSAVLAGAVAGLGSGFAIATPLISALAGYVTGSNSASAAMLAPGLSDAATGLGMDPAQVLAVVMIAASSAVMVNPPRLALAVSLAQSSPGPTGAAGHVEVDVATTSEVMKTVVMANGVLLLALMGLFFTVIMT